jgi:2-C-methyl-D-erythritol 2,4-cyclodiphosphate synthase/2-C-methyl-D-erythritol 4-phosphate cytidylyltransferase
MLAWVLASLEACKEIERVVVVAPAGDVERVWHLAVGYGIGKLCHVVAGGPDRQSSVLNGMETVLNESSVLLVHDAARPLTPPEVMARCAAAADEHGLCTTALPVADTLRQGSVNAIAGGLADRSGMVRIQTPQAVRADVLARCFDECRRVAAACTDDPSMVERAGGGPTWIIEGSEMSLKVTTPGDLALANTLARAGHGVRPGSVVGGFVGQDAGRLAPDITVGLGYDVHAFDEGRPMMLGGLYIPDSPGLAGHSDADAALHAICDSILGAIGERDIGYHFPPTDDRWEGADSGKLLERVVAIALEKGWRPHRVDLTVVAEKPRLGPHVEAMRRRVGELAGIDPALVAVKATTNERMGFVGRGEGVACLALTTLRSWAL